MTTATTETLVAELALALTEECCGTAHRSRILSDRTQTATSIASAALQPYVPAGLLHWLVPAQVRESPRGYARRVIRCMIARATQAGTPSSLRAENAEHVGMRDGHGSTTAWGFAVDLVSTIERAIDRRGAIDGAKK